MLVCFLLKEVFCINFIISSIWMLNICIWNHAFRRKFVPSFMGLDPLPIVYWRRTSYSWRYFIAIYIVACLKVRHCYLRCACSFCLSFCVFSLIFIFLGKCWWKFTVRVINFAAKALLFRKKIYENCLQHFDGCMSWMLLILVSRDSIYYLAFSFSLLLFSRNWILTALCLILLQPRFLVPLYFVRLPVFCSISEHFGMMLAVPWKLDQEPERFTCCWFIGNNCRRALFRHKNSIWLRVCLDILK